MGERDEALAILQCARLDYLRFQGALAHFISLGYSYAKAQAAALASIDQALTAQALMLSYNDTWMLILKSFIITAPAILVIRKPRGRAAAGDMH